MRTGSALVRATKAYCEEDPRRSWAAVLSTFALWGGALALTVALPVWPAKLAAAGLAALFHLRAFMLYHDHNHGSLLPRSPFARLLFRMLGIYQLIPTSIWRETHNHHHAHNAKLEGSHIGYFVLVSTRAWREMSGIARLGYRFIRHPMGFPFSTSGYTGLYVLAPLYNFLRSDRRNHWDSLLALAVHAGLLVGVPFVAGWATYLFSVLLPIALMHGIATYLLYIQHNFPEMHVMEADDWDYNRSALECSSFLEAGPVVHWFSANIGYHHIHHLNPKIPFYRLPEAMRDLPELQDAPRVSLSLASLRANFRLGLWDPDAGKMVPYP